MALDAPACEGGTCELLGPFGIFVQCMIGLWCLLTLFMLWRCEEKRRPFLNWLGDMSKQFVGAGWGHFMNVFLALLVGKNLTTDTRNNECVWYLMGFLSDIFLVTFLCWWVTSNARPVIRRRCGIDIGEYDTASAEKDNQTVKRVSSLVALAPWQMWCVQTGIWLFIMTAVKFVVTVFVFLAQDYLYVGLALIFKQVGLCHHQRAQLLVSVIVVPVIGDAFQLAVQDGFLKHKDEAAVDDASKPFVASSVDDQVSFVSDWEGSETSSSSTHDGIGC